MVRDLLFIIVGERRAILGGLVTAFFLVLPFTFIPAIVRHGLSIDVIMAHASVSVLYTVGFALLVVVIAVIYNYEGVADRKWYFNRPAFRRLDLRRRVDGVDSVVCDLQIFLLGQIQGYHFRLVLVDTDPNNPRLEIIPAVELTGKELEIKILKADYGFIQRLFLTKIIPLNEIDLGDKDSIHAMLEDEAGVLKAFGFEPIPFEDVNR